MSGQPKSEIRALETKLSRAMGQCISEFELIEAGDRVMVCVSGGKDSYAMLTLLERFRRKAPIEFELVAVHLDQGQPNYDGTPLVRWLEVEGFDYRILREDTYSVVMDHASAGKTYCAMCSRLRRGVLYNAAVELGCSKIALGHHRDDAIETLMLNLLFTGALAAMPPKLISQDGRNTVIRPLLYVREPGLLRYAELMAFPILPCDLCGSQDNLKRQQVKRLLAELEGIAPGARDSMLAALGNVKATHLFDADLWRALGLSVAPDEEGALGALEGPGLASRTEARAIDAGAQVSPARAQPPSGGATIRRLPLLS